MGYSHNWRRPTELPAKVFAAAAADCREVVPNIGVHVGGFDGSGSPAFDDTHIVFNGQEPGICEPFEVVRVEFDRRGRLEVWSFCKTEHLPYDLCVKVALIILAHHFGDAFTVGSDGGDEDWVEAKRIVQERLGYGDDFRLRRD